jgi:sialate O-acetylesterase
LAAAPPLLNPLFEDHAVLQRGRPIPVWGETSAGAAVTVTLGAASASATADAAGRWRALLPAMEAGGPYALEAKSSSGAVAAAQDILLGDVFLCAGQSNMVLGVNRSLNARAEIENAADDGIRLLTVPQETSLVPRSAFATSAVWAAASPQTVPEFSAACFYFARELRKSVHVPLGLINASWGGANILSFMSEDAVRASGKRDAGLAVLDLYRSDPTQGIARWADLWETWWHDYALKHGEPADPWASALGTEGFVVAPTGLGRWDDWSSTALPGFTGQVWYRTTVTVTPEQAGEPATLSLGAINEEDMTFVDGHAVGTTFGYGSDRRYALAPNTLHAGENSIAVSVLCTYRGCGMFGSPQKRVLSFAQGGSVPLDNSWSYRVGAPMSARVPRAPWGAVAGLGMAYNGMIAPLGGYGLRGVVWYQGESNTGEALAYRDLLSGLMGDWRRSFGADLPFLVVQLPDYGRPPTKPEDSQWAALREAQREAVAQDPHAALIVTIDIGEHSDLHPPDKQNVGRRLARATLNLIYGQNIRAGGPVAVSVRRAGRHVLIGFRDVEKQLVAYNAATPIGFELCGSLEASSCRFASAHLLRGDAVTLDVPERFVPTHVRYCWADGPVCTLFDEEGLPVAPFDLPIASSRSSKKRQAVHTALTNARARGK